MTYITAKEKKNITSRKKKKTNKEERNFKKNTKN